MAMIKCKECGKEVSDKAKTCIHCGCPVNESNAKKDNITINTISSKLSEKKVIFVIGFIVVALLVVIISKLSDNSSTINIVGNWECDYTDSNLTSNNKKIEYRFRTGNSATSKITKYGIGYKYGAEESKTYKCSYKFRNNNAEIKISCNYGDDDDVKYKNNMWVSFQLDKDIIYIDNKKCTKNFD